MFVVLVVQVMHHNNAWFLQYNTLKEGYSVTNVARHIMCHRVNTAKAYVA